jgi:DNA-binding CsgD family transcriptional regulator
MNEVENSLQKILEVIAQNKAFFHFEHSVSFEKLCRICDEAYPQFLLVTDFDDHCIKHMNPAVSSYFGVENKEVNKMGFQFILKLIHPENMHIIQMVIKYFSNSDNFDRILAHTFYIKTARGWRWVYACIKPVIFKADGKPKNLLAVGCDIDDLLETRKQFRVLKNNIDFVEDNAQKYLSLSEREKEVLKLISQEYASKEIADKLHLSVLTVDTHRKNLIQKLGVKSSMGLVKYAVLFDL